MSEQPAPEGDRRVRTRRMVENLLAERQEVLVMLWRVGGLTPSSDGKPVHVVVQEFCQILVDYVAAGHFDLYKRISEGTERRQRVARLAERLYPRITETTEHAVAFNDKYEKLGERILAEDLARDLSDLGEQLASRVEVEDALIDALQAGS